MLTSTVPELAPRPPKPSYRPFSVAVAGIRRLSDSFTRVTFSGADLHEFGTIGLDQRVKVILPLPGIGMSPLPEDDTWYDAWRRLPDAERNPIRTYTVRAVRPAAREIDIDFVMHGDGGPASRWAGAAAVGERLVVVGPNAGGEFPRSGVEWNPGDATTLLLAGDETAAPAICSILGSLPADARGTAIIEVPHARDALDVAAPAGMQVTWLVRDAAGSAHGAALDAAVREWTSGFISSAPAGGGADADLNEVDVDTEILWEVPDAVAADANAAHSTLYAWLAGEAGVIKTLRRFLVSETGIDRRQVAFMGYWRAGRSEAN
ncbi:siderophore-interacting protein [Leifsonia sp. YAF41]|uniref:siderophore-interacting protein n=1 Tax=Leifsonia sp. YAF41 TaxID=3233086 RepID=UPI003F994ED7